MGIKEATGDIVYTVRAAESRFRPPVYKPGRYTVHVGPQKPDQVSFQRLSPAPADARRTLKVRLK